jgi:hypothetical protein
MLILPLHFPGCISRRNHARLHRDSFATVRARSSRTLVVVGINGRALSLRVMHKPIKRPLQFAVPCLAFVCSACTAPVLGRVVSDVRVGNGWISVDKCELEQLPMRGLRVRNCQTQNYYVGSATVAAPHTATTK